MPESNDPPVNPGPPPSCGPYPDKLVIGGRTVTAITPGDNTKVPSVLAIDFGQFGDAWLGAATYSAALAVRRPWEAKWLANMLMTGYDRLPEKERAFIAYMTCNEEIKNNGINYFVWNPETSTASDKEDPVAIITIQKLDLMVKANECWENLIKFASWEPSNETGQTHCQTSPEGEHGECPICKREREEAKKDKNGRKASPGNGPNTQQGT